MPGAHDFPLLAATHRSSSTPLIILQLFLSFVNSIENSVKKYLATKEIPEKNLRQNSFRESREKSPGMKRSPYPGFAYNQESSGLF